MSSDQLSLPYALVDYKERVEVRFLYDDKNIRSVQGPVPVDVPECPVPPLVTLQCVNNRNEPVGPVYAYDYEREDWLVYDERIHEVPKSGPVDVGTPSRQLDMSAKSTVELTSESAPTLESPPVEEDEDELVEPSYDVGGEEEDEEDAV